MHYCRCGVTMVDGGFDYFRCGWDSKKCPNPPKDMKKWVSATRNELFYDWNYNINEYGIIGVKNWNTKGLKK